MYMLTSARTQLFVSLVNAALKPALYDANELGYTSQVTATPQGLILTFGGLSDQQIMRRLISLTMDSKSSEGVGHVFYWKEGKVTYHSPSSLPSGGREGMSLFNWRHTFLREGMSV